MTVTDAIAAIRATTLHDSDSQVTDAQITAKLDREYQLLRRQLQLFVPTLYETPAAATISSGSTSFNKPTGFERFRKLERLISGTNYFVVPVGEALNVNHTAELSCYEQGSTIVLRPDADAPDRKS